MTAVEASQTASVRRYRRQFRTGAHTLLNQAFVFGVLIAIWYLASRAKLVGYDLLPPPADVVAALLGLPYDQSFWPAVQATVSSALLGLLISALIGIPLGLLIGSQRWFYESTRLIVDLFRSWPTIALLPVLILLFGASFKMKVAVVVLAAVWPILIQSAYGARRLDSQVTDMLRSYRIPARLRFFEIVLPNALPFIMTGLRISTSLCILVAVATELLASVPGIGYQISIARNYGAAAEVLAYVLISGAIGVCVNAIFAASERWILAWHPSIWTAAK